MELTDEKLAVIARHVAREALNTAALANRAAISSAHLFEEHIVSVVHRRLCEVVAYERKRNTSVMGARTGDDK